MSSTLKGGSQQVKVGVLGAGGGGWGVVGGGWGVVGGVVEASGLSCCLASKIVTVPVGRGVVMWYRIGEKFHLFEGFLEESLSYSSCSSVSGSGAAWPALLVRYSGLNLET